jgi:flagellar operon protein (TIGR03826 family)
MAELANCPKCGKAFVRDLRKVCNVCYKEEEEMYEKVNQFIRKRENREATIVEVHEATGVPEDTIVRFVKEGRLRAAHMANLTYECESCGGPITKGRICTNCTDRMKQELNIHDQEKKRQELARQATYFSDRK